MTSLIFLSLAAICNAVMDIIAHHFWDSIFFRQPNLKWWNSKISWNNKYNADNTRKKWLWGLIKKPVQITDAWHFFKMIMIIFIIIAIVTYDGMELWYYLPLSYIAWNGTFVLFYKYFLRKNKMKNMVKWLERNMIAITIIALFTGILIFLINNMAYYVILEYLYLSLFGITVIGTILQLIWAWIINPIREYRKNKKK